MKLADRILIVFGIFSLVAVVLFATLVPPNFIRSGHPPRIGCINNLRQIDGAKQQWAIVYQKGSNAIPTWNDIQPYLGRASNGKLRVCPEGGTYTIGKLSEIPKCSKPGHVLE